jgi:hypothetical protein
VLALRAVLLAGLLYGVIGLTFGAAADRVLTTQARFDWRLAAWVVSGVVFVVHITYAQLRLRASPPFTALQASSGAALGALVLAVLRRFMHFGSARAISARSAWRSWCGRPRRRCPPSWWRLWRRQGYDSSARRCAGAKLDSRKWLTTLVNVRFAVGRRVSRFLSGLLSSYTWTSKVLKSSTGEVEFESLVRPGFHNKNLLTVVNGAPISARHAKSRRQGYRREPRT